MAAFIEHEFVPEVDHASPNVGIIALLFQSLTDIIASIVKDFRKNGGLPRRDVASLRRAAQSIVQWGDNHEVLRGRLDSKLHKSKRLHDTTLEILYKLGLLLAKGKLRVRGSTR